MLKLYFLGSPKIELDGRTVFLDRRKAIAILAYLVDNEGPSSRDQLAGLLWPELDQSRSRAALRRTLMTLKKALPGPFFVMDRKVIALDEGTVWSDLQQFNQGIKAFEQQTEELDNPTLKQALALYRGDFLAGFSVRDSAPFEEWQLFRSESLRCAYHRSAMTMIRHLHKQGSFADAISLARGLLESDPLLDDANRMLMRLYAEDGQRMAALRHYDHYHDLLRQDLGEDPSWKTRELYLSIKNGELGEREEHHFTPPARAETFYLDDEQIVQEAHQRLDRLCRTLTPFFGRSQELFEIRELLENETCRLITLLGQGGAGKTRLALQIAQDYISQVEGVFFTPLAALSHPEQVISTMAAAFKLSFHGPVDQKALLLRFLCDKRYLLILDNMEHLPGLAELVSEILEVAPQIKILTTSRERLKLRQEWLLRIRGLTWPRSVEEKNFAETDAVRLFAYAAGKVQPGFEPDRHRESILRIARLVDGLPLAIELASSWLRCLPCDEVERQIRSNIDFLTSDFEDVPVRHRSIRFVFDQSLQLLSEREQKVLRGLSIFRDGFSLEAAMSVTGANFKDLSTLADKSLLHTPTSGRYELHELLRQYLANTLSEQEEQEFRACHSSFFLEMLSAIRKDLAGENQGPAVERIATDLGNIREAWRYGLKQNQFGQIDKTLLSLFIFYETKTWFKEARVFFEKALKQLARFPKNEEHTIQRIKARIQINLGWVHFRLARFSEASTILAEARTVFEQQRQSDDLAFVHFVQAMVAQARANFPEARRLYKQCLAFTEETGNTWAGAHALIGLSRIAVNLGDIQNADALCARNHPHVTQFQFPILAAFHYNALGDLARIQGNFGKAEEHYLLSMEYSKKVDYQLGIPVSLLRLARLYPDRGRYAESPDIYARCLKRFEELSYAPGVGECLVLMARAAFHQKQFDQARKLAETALLISEQIGHPPGRADALSCLGRIEIEVGRDEAGERCFQHCLELCQELGLKLHEVKVRIKLGRLGLRRKAADVALSGFLTALDQAISIDARTLSYDALLGLAEAYLLSEEEQFAGVFLGALTRQSGLRHKTRKRLESLADFAREGDGTDVEKLARHHLLQIGRRSVERVTT